MRVIKAIKESEDWKLLAIDKKTLLTFLKLLILWCLVSFLKILMGMPLIWMVVLNGSFEWNDDFSDWLSQSMIISFIFHFFFAFNNMFSFYPKKKASKNMNFFIWLHWIKFINLYIKKKKEAIFTWGTHSAIVMQEFWYMPLIQEVSLLKDMLIKSQDLFTCKTYIAKKSLTNQDP